MYPTHTQLLAKWSSPSIGDQRATGCGQTWGKKCPKSSWQAFTPQCPYGNISHFKKGASFNLGAYIGRHSPIIVLSLPNSVV